MFPSPQDTNSETAGAPGWLEEIGSNDDATGGTSTSSVRFRAVARTTYFFAVDGFDNGFGTIKISLAGDQPKKAPNWTLPDLQGNPISWTQYLGKVVVLDFWATWCGPCIAEIPDFIDLQNQYGAEGFAFIGVSLDRDPDYLNTVRDFALQYGMNYDVVYDREGVVEELFGGISSIPTTFIIDRNGAIVETFVGMHSKQAFENEIKPLLAAVIVATPPVFSAGLLEGKLVLNWPDDGGPFAVKSAIALQGPWNPVPNSPHVVGAVRQISLEPTSATFFRLVAQ